jgi:hypothetical protein
MHGLQEKLKGLPRSISTWGPRTFGNVQRELRTLRHQLSNLRSTPGRVGPSYEELNVVERLVEL